MILAIDPGNKESAFVVVENDLDKVLKKGKVSNDELMDIIRNLPRHDIDHIAIEMIASYGMAVGATVFDTCVWIGQFKLMCQTIFDKDPTLIYRKDEKMCLCHSMRAKDSNIRQALIDRFGGVGTKKDPGYFYGFKKDIWSAMAVAVAFHDLYLAKDQFGLI
ncbi:hypothetical protein EDX97_07825 [Absicoccus porci]|uniref:Holliday junction resolvase RuvC n=1 Tax=Absicoccus porci TaxID=2486576 RepID=A0A3N0I0X6_9FIRM|nr:hypothetical protein [Absicoccus porci]RNM30679.1 hypothetical protein EDX97_07825 [Absicoccus porci]